MNKEAAKLLLPLLVVAAITVVVAAVALATLRPDLRPLRLSTQAVQDALQPATP
jgi:hypothetical protein